MIIVYFVKLIKPKIISSAPLILRNHYVLEAEKRGYMGKKIFLSS